MNMKNQKITISVIGGHDTNPEVEELAHNVGIIIAGSNLTQQYQYNLIPKFQKDPEYLSPRYALHFMDTDHVGTLSEIFSIHGEGFTVGGASASGNVAIIKDYVRTNKPQFRNSILDEYK